jgi:hypothetical protein
MSKAAVEELVMPVDVSPGPMRRSNHQNDTPPPRLQREPTTKREAERC